jgi:hypothetical protein
VSTYFSPIVKDSHKLSKKVYGCSKILTSEVKTARYSRAEMLPAVEFSLVLLASACVLREVTIYFSAFCLTGPEDVNLSILRVEYFLNITYRISESGYTLVYNFPKDLMSLVLRKTV